MADGFLKLELNEARAKAQEMLRISSELEELFNNVNKLIDTVNNVDTNIYVGNKKPAQLRAELEDFAREFPLARNQIVSFANGIIMTANVSESQ